MKADHKAGIQIKETKINNIARVGAYLIDWYIASMFAGIPITLIASTVNHSKLVTMELAKIQAPWGLIAGILAIVFYLGYYVILELKVYKGQTFGKRLMKLKVVQDDGSDVTFKTIMMREGLGVMLVEGYIAQSSSYVRQIIQMFIDVNIMDYLVYGFGIISIVSILLGMTSYSRKMIHDRIAKTKLISVKEEE